MGRTKEAKVILLVRVVVGGRLFFSTGVEANMR